MALVINDRVKETSTTTGTGTLTLDGAVTGFETFSSAIGNSNTTYYAIELPNTAEFEVGLGTVAAGTLARTTVISSSNSDALVDFSAGTKNVFCTLPASKAVIEDASNNVTLPADLTVDTDTLYVDSSNNRVGIGTTSPSTLLHLSSSDPQITITDTDGTGSQVIKAVTDNLEIVSSNHIKFDADSGLFVFKDSGVDVLSITNSGNIIFKPVLSNSDLVFKGNDGGSEITALTLDMSEAGAATFNDKIILGANKVIEFGDAGETISGDGTKITVNSSGRLDLLGTSVFLNGSATTPVLFSSQGVQFGDLKKENGTDLVLRSSVSDGDLVLRGNDGGSNVDALTLDMSEAGAATFNDKVILGANKVIEFGDAGENISGDGTNLLINSSGYTELTSSGNIILNGSSIQIKDGGTNTLGIDTISGALNIVSRVINNDIIFKGNDGSVTSLTLDMSAAGAATFNSSVTVGANLDVSSGTIKLDGNYPTGTNNVALGNTALDSLTSGNENTAIGANALTAMTTQGNSTAVGYNAASSSTGGNNTAIGASALATNVTGIANVAVGKWAARLATSNYNVAVGEGALGSQTGGYSNTAVGQSAGSSITSGNNLTVLGYNAEPSAATATNEITLGDANVTSLRIPGLASGASSGDVLTYDGTDITLSAPTGVSAGFSIAMAIAL